MYYAVRHLTKFRYAFPVSESIMEVRMHPRTEGNQRCLMFHLSVSPRCRVFSYRDHLNNNVHHFDIPGQHSQLVIVAESVVEMQPMVPLPASLGPTSWDELDALVHDNDYSELLLPSEMCQPTEELRAFARELDLRRKDDPLSLLVDLNEKLYNAFDYAPMTTHVDTPINEVLRTRKGVCQDFAHIMITMIRELRIPCRYVSGFLYRSKNTHDRSAEDATHAWVEVLLPQLGFVGFDPTNCLIAGDRHIRTAVGRDYADVPPTRGLYRGMTASELAVGVRVSVSEQMPQIEPDLPIPEDWSMVVEKASEPISAHLLQQIQQQQQQQQADRGRR
jgi:transglutaminase-like putative cysteine protease